MNKSHLSIVLMLLFASHKIYSMQEAWLHTCEKFTAATVSHQTNDLDREETTQSSTLRTPWMSSRWKQWVKDSKSIITAALKNPQEIAELTASSPCLVNQILKGLADSSSKNPHILEIGFGDGTVTEEALHIIKDGSIDAIEADKNLYEHTKKRLQSSGVRFHCGYFPDDFIQPQDVDQYDHIICTVPFKMLPRDSVERILKKSRELLKPGGTFTYISLIGARSLGYIRDRSHDYKKKLSLLDEWEARYFESSVRLVWWNIVPVWVHTLQLKEEPHNKKVSGPIKRHRT